MVDHWHRKREILTLLGSEKFVSGEWLAQELGVSRTAINKHIEGLIELGVAIYSVKSKGYKLASPVRLANEDTLKFGIKNRCFYFNQIDSTNGFVLQHVNELERGDICVAECQSGGRGRRGKAWLSPYGSHLYFTQYWQTAGNMAQLMGLSLIVGCSVVTVLERLGVTGLGLKWPNDVYLDGKKLSGILVELQGQADGGCHLAIGIGINLFMPQQIGAHIDQPWSDLSDIVPVLDKNRLIVGLQKQLSQDLTVFEQQGLTAFIDRWKKSDIFMDKSVNILLGDSSVSGVYQGIDEQGGVVLTTDKGKQSFIGGEISLRASFTK
ncbi:bifunctional biotin--[acetyl-CoA-carboxylase] ligase/biotin operon repressor BirA [Shewanella sp. NIFS-20-20]|uniref:bifunctional biotin--[acetyl-CoA-carboxylase] ligase/biotin operon repressor BirA n=1 Tax=Shewanella sp. NIFS-20-20 TaxID=2853806 RepID=UPI001C489695|nr:bifunctional biotin--[acetyl-CoA-carboxylase] ligase/biotin operon repressor BirA [Shewanella sp. NIFS-20-20]MBV7316453.1 bifunctional biotin--[acetyl-CoA-carboxylase] ligase/biotin operon repressor BirA [Shewanella sp. NIFS-20-20]